MQSLLYLTRIYTQLGTDFHNNVSIVLFMFIITAMVCEVIQPERLNAEGFSPSALSRGLSVSATLGIPTTPKEKRLNDAKTAAKASDIRVLRIMVGRHDTEGYASLHPRLRATRFARAFDLSGRAAVIDCGKQVTISLSEAVRRVGQGHHTGRCAPFVWC